MVQMNARYSKKKLSFDFFSNRLSSCFGVGFINYWIGLV
jgi:hypothetical protein